MIYLKSTHRLVCQDGSLIELLRKESGEYTLALVSSNGIRTMIAAFALIDAAESMFDLIVTRLIESGCVVVDTEELLV